MNIKNCIFLILYIFSNYAFGQPTPISGNLNGITKEALNTNPYLGVIIIDKNTDLNRAYILNEIKKDFRLYIELDSIPKEFNKFDFSNITGITIECSENLKDITNLKYFENLKKLSVNNFKGKYLSKENIPLRMLKFFSISNSPNLISLESIFHLENLERIILNDLPKFSEYTEDFKHLKKVDSLSLTKLNIEKIPDFFPTNLSFLYIQEPSPSRRKLKDIQNLKLYKNLKDLRLTGMDIDVGKPDLYNLRLENLFLELNYYTQKFDFIFSFGEIKNLRLETLHSYVYSKNDMCITKITNIYLESMINLNDINSFFECDENSIEKITVRHTGIKTLPDLSKLTNIPILLIEYNRQLMQSDTTISENWKIQKNGIYFNEKE